MILLHSLTFLQPGANLPVSSDKGRTVSPTEPGFSPGFFSILSPIEFWFLPSVASGRRSWGHFMYSDIVDLIANYCTDTI